MESCSTYIKGKNKITELTAVKDKCPDDAPKIHQLFQGIPKDQAESMIHTVIVAFRKFTAKRPEKDKQPDGNGAEKKKQLDGNRADKDELLDAAARSKLAQDRVIILDREALQKLYTPSLAGRPQFIEEEIDLNEPK